MLACSCCSGVSDRLGGLFCCAAGLLANHQKESALTIASDDLLELRTPMIPRRSWRGGLQQPALEIGPPRCGWNAAHERHAGVSKPVEHFVHGVRRLMRMPVLVFEPRLSFVAAERRLTQIRIEPLRASSRQLEESASQLVHQPAVPIVEPDDDVAAGLHERHERLETFPRVSCVMQNSVAKNDVELLVPERGPKQVHLYEPHARQPMRPAKLFGQAQ